MTTLLWVSFILFVLFLLALDLGVFHRKDRAISTKEALLWSGVWVGVSLAFNVFVYFLYENRWFGISPGPQEPDGGAAAMMFLTGYVLEKSLSIDNIFVIAMVLAFFRIPPTYQHRVLFWGILGALLLRGAMIGAGTALIERFHWMLYVFGGLLLLTALRLLLSRSEPDPSKNFFVRLIRRYLPITDDLHGRRFTVRIAGKLFLTPLALALIVVEASDVLFAVDSIPAIFAVTEDAFLVFTSNVFAILGLRSLYFALAGIIDRFHYLKLSLCVLLALIGVKMLLKDVLHAVPGLTFYTLGAIALVLGGGILASIARARRLRRDDVPCDRSVRVE